MGYMNSIEFRENVALNLMRSAQEVKSWSKERASIGAPMIFLFLSTLPFLGSIEAGGMVGGNSDYWIDIGKLLFLMTEAGEIGNIVGRMSEGRITIQKSSSAGPNLSRDMKRLAKVIQPKIG